jgi:hypothetical protein
MRAGWTAVIGWGAAAVVVVALLARLLTARRHAPAAGPVANHVASDSADQRVPATPGIRR